MPGFTPDTILTSGPTLPWASYVGGQRAAVIGAGTVQAPIECFQLAAEAYRTRYGAA